ncbi:MAG TPA: DNA helicase RecG, partial [bacterium]|nr:DNA helicase RecG [bacterium]
IRSEIKKGKQVFVVCPRIEPRQTNNDWSEVTAVKEEYEKLSKKVFPKLKVRMLHGKLKSKEKQQVMKGFKSGKTNVLVSTSVVEVGIDIKNATIMIIEGAERFGLAQLHQFRGRIGRGKDQSYCFLFTSTAEIRTTRRLQALLKSNDGFELAEKDLAIRGPGDMFGVRQWGVPDLIMASLKDVELIERTRLHAKQVLQQDPNLKKHPLLADRIKQFDKTIHLE